MGFERGEQITFTTIGGMDLMGVVVNKLEEEDHDVYLIEDEEGDQHEIQGCNLERVD